MTGFVEPSYGSRSLADVMPAVAAALGHPIQQPPDGLVLPDAPSYVLFLVDGLGAELLRRYAHSAPFLSELLDDAGTGTAGVPSTTATSLTSLGTALPPGSHGMVGFTSRVPGTDGCSTRSSGTRPSTPWSGSPTRPRSPGSRARA